MKLKIGKDIYNFGKKIWSYNRSITGKGTLKTLQEVKKLLPELKIKKVKSGTKAFDWIVPDEWNVEDAYIIDPQEKICSIKKNNLHLVGYSIPVNKKLTFQELNKNFSLYQINLMLFHTKLLIIKKIGVFV